MPKIIALSLLFFSTMAFAQYNVHSHNDYEQKVPFWSAYSSGCTSIEVDIILNNNELYAAHNLKDIKPSSTIENLYLIPLSVISEADKYGAFNLQILIDIKTDANATLKLLQSQLEKYPILFNGTDPNKKISFVISGNRPLPMEYQNYPPYLNFDYQTIDTFPADMTKVALVSLPFYKFSKWNGEGILTKEDEEKIKSAIKTVHDQGKKIRFWATPDTKVSWFKFASLGVDFINTDQPFACSSYLKELK